MNDNDRLTKLENYFKMRGNRIEHIEESITDLESNIDTLHNLAIRLVKDIDEIKSNESTNKKLEETVTRLIADIQSELNDKSISPNKQRIFPSIYDSEPGNVVLSMGVYPVHLYQFPKLRLHINLCVPASPSLRVKSSVVNLNKNGIKRSL